MPEQQGLTECQVEMTIIDMDGVFAFYPAGSRLLDSRWNEVQTRFEQCSDLAAVIRVFGDNWFTRLFGETWSALPSRLASLAIRPPSASYLSLRPDFDPLLFGTRLLSSASTFSHWMRLIDLAKDASRVEVHSIPIEWTSTDAAAKATDLDECFLPELLSTPPCRELSWVFGELKLARLSDLCGEVVSPADATAVLAGLWLLLGDADASHRQSQSIEEEGRHRCGNFWHAIMHRQEPDYGNSKYWFRRVGQHSIFPELARWADELIGADGSESARRWRTKLGTPDRWDPFAFVDWCEAAAREADVRQTQLIRRIQFVEMHLLLRASFEDATRST